MEEIMKSGILGDIKLVRTTWNGFSRRYDWQTLIKREGGAMRNTGPHSFEQCISLAGTDEMPKKIYSRLGVWNSVGDAAELGYDGIQFRGSAPKEMPELSFRGFAEIVATAKKKYGLSAILFGIGVANCTSEDKEAREKGIANAIENAKIANDLCGTTVSNCFGHRLLSTIPNAPRNGDSIWFAKQDLEYYKDVVSSI